MATLSAGTLAVASYSSPFLVSSTQIKHTVADGFIVFNFAVKERHDHHRMPR
jgi:hypothetical protein